MERRLEIRNARYAERVRTAGRKVFPKDTSKHIKFHDLRHSYAIHLLNQGVPIGLVAQALGDSVQVTQENYLGFCLTDEGVSMVRTILDGKAR
jgi:integrase